MSPRGRPDKSKITRVVEKLRVEATTITSFVNRAAANGAEMLAGDLRAQRERLADLADILERIAA